MEIALPFTNECIDEIKGSDLNDVATMFGDSTSEDAQPALKELLDGFARSEALYQDLVELKKIGFQPYLFILYYECVTLEKIDRMPGAGVYECHPRADAVGELYNKMFNNKQQNPFLNNAKSVYELNASWAVTKKLESKTKDGGYKLADIFDIMSELPYSTRRRVAHVIRCYIVLIANETSVSSELGKLDAAHIRRFIETVCAVNSSTYGVLDQRLVDFLTFCSHDITDWSVRGLGASVNESNVSAKKLGDVEYLNLKDKHTVQAYEAHGGVLRDVYVRGHINSLAATVGRLQEDSLRQGRKYDRNIEVIYVAHSVLRLENYSDGDRITIKGIPFTLHFKTYEQLVSESGGIDYLCSRVKLFNELIHKRISRLPDSNTLKTKYREIIEM